MFVVVVEKKSCNDIWEKMICKQQSCVLKSHPVSSPAKVSWHNKTIIPLDTSTFASQKQQSLLTKPQLVLVRKTHSKPKILEQVTNVVIS